ncbi:MAG TPA: hypothetical protein VHN99_09640 [Deinococcales bacterium]|nr:hypothetical protein [Deinococcales bacterium]
MKGTTILDVNGQATSSHEFCRRYVEPDTEFLDTPRVVLLPLHGRALETLEERWTWDGIRACTLVFHARDVNGTPEAELKALATAHFGVHEAPRPLDPKAPGVDRDAVSVSVSRGAGQSFVLVTVTRWAELDQG